MAAGIFGLHQLRFALSGEDPEAVHGHGYLTIVAPLLAGVLLLGLTLVLARLVRGAGERATSIRRTWAAATGVLIAVYCAQEAIEGQHSLFGHGGWLVLPLAVAIGLVIALLARGSAASLRIRRWQAWAPAHPLVVLLPPPRTRPAFVAFLAMPGRSPPFASL